MSAKADSLRSLMLPIAGGHMLVPNGNLAEVAHFIPPEPFEDAPDWLLGTVEWNRWSVPVVAFGLLVRAAEAETPQPKSRIVILKALRHSERMPYIGVLVEGVPRVVDLKPEMLTIEDEPERRTIGLLAQGEIRKKTVLVPDLDRLAQLVAHAAFGAVPVTEL